MTLPLIESAVWMVCSLHGEFHTRKYIKIVLDDPCVGSFRLHERLIVVQITRLAATEGKCLSMF